MHAFNLNDDEMWLIPKLRALSATQQEVIYMLVRHMSDRSRSLAALPANILPLELQALVRQKSRTSGQ